MTRRIRIAAIAAIKTALYLVGGLVAGIVLGNLISNGLEGHINEPLRTGSAAVPAIGGVVLGSALWGTAMGRLARSDSRVRMAWAGILGFVPVTIGLSILLLFAEPVALRLWGRSIPIHRLYTLLFVPTAFLITATMSVGIGTGLRLGALRWRVALRAGLAGAAAFLLIDLLMEAMGWVVGSPGAADRFTMLVVTFAGDIGAALAGGAVLGFALGTRGEAAPVAR